MAVSMRRRTWIQRVGFASLALATVLTVIPIVLVVGIILFRGAPAINLEFLTAMPRDGMKAGGIMPAIVGTFLLALGTAIASVPFGIGAAKTVALVVRASQVQTLSNGIELVE